MDFEIPEAGTPEYVDLMCLLDKSRYDNVREWIVVVVDDESGEIIHGYGPFDEAEQALVEAGEQEAWWRENEPNLATSTYKIVPLWGPGE